MHLQPAELLVNQFSYLDVNDLGSVAKVSKYFYALSKAKELWRRLVWRDFKEENGTYEVYKARLTYEINLKMPLKKERNFRSEVNAQMAPPDYPCSQTAWVSDVKIHMHWGVVDIYRKGVWLTSFNLYNGCKVEDCGYSIVHFYNDQISVLFSLEHMRAFQCKEKGRTLVTTHFIVHYNQRIHVYCRSTLKLIVSAKLLSYMVKDSEFIGMLDHQSLVIINSICEFHECPRPMIPSGRINQSTLLLRDEASFLFTFNLDTGVFQSLAKWGTFLYEGEKCLLFAHGANINILLKNDLVRLASIQIGSPVRVIKEKNNLFLMQQKETLFILSGLDGALYTINKPPMARFIGWDNHLIFFATLERESGELSVSPWSLRTKDFVPSFKIVETELKKASSVSLGYEIDSSTRNSLLISYFMGKIKFDYFDRETTPGRVVHRNWCYLTPNAR